MQIKCGTDLVFDKRIEEQLKNKTFLERVFHPSELRNLQTQTLAGIFAVKESVLKALALSTEHWHDIEVIHGKNGKARVHLSAVIKPPNLVSLDCSISHEQGYTLAFVVLLLRNEL